jgi:hypothetical protein
MYVFLRRERLEVGCRVGASTWVVVLLEVGLERCGRGGRVLLVAKSGTCAGHQIVVILTDALLTAPHAPTDESNTTKEDGTTNTTNDTANDALFSAAQSTAAAWFAFLRRG